MNIEERTALIGKIAAHLSCASDRDIEGVEKVLEAHAEKVYGGWYRADDDDSGQLAGEVESALPEGEVRP